MAVPFICRSETSGLSPVRPSKHGQDRLPVGIGSLERSGHQHLCPVWLVGDGKSYGTGPDADRVHHRALLAQTAVRFLEKRHYAHLFIDQEIARVFALLVEIKSNANLYAIKRRISRERNRLLKKRTFSRQNDAQCHRSS